MRLKYLPVDGICLHQGCDPIRNFTFRTRSEKVRNVKSDSFRIRPVRNFAILKLRINIHFIFQFVYFRTGRYENIR